MSQPWIYTQAKTAADAEATLRHYATPEDYWLMRRVPFDEAKKRAALKLAEQTTPVEWRELTDAEQAVFLEDADEVLRAAFGEE